MLKAKKYDWKDSNLALLGSDTEKKVKKESAESEPAWEGAGQEPGLKIWRIEQFKVVEWPEENYGDFYQGDSYIILYTYQEEGEDEMKFDIHFWIGKDSTQDEYGTAAYKTVELDTFLDDKPIQHRETQGHESKKFLSYFKNITYLQGGVDTGFRRVLPEDYAPRLFHVKKHSPKNIIVTQVPASRKCVNSDDVFILDLGKEFYQFNGANSSNDERFKAAQYIQTLCDNRGDCDVKRIDEESDARMTESFYDLLKDDGDVDKVDEPDDAKVLLKVCDADGSLDMEEVSQGEDITRESLDSDSVMLVRINGHMYVWVGSGASIEERKNGISYAHNYLKDTRVPWLPITVLVEGKENEDFNAALAA